jgi:transposase InsO family protein
MLPYCSNAQGVFKGFKFEFSNFEICFEEHLREYQKVVLTYFLKKIDLRLSRTQPTKYLLTMIDCFSKYAWAIPFKNKTADEIFEAFTLIFKERKPKKLRTDKGKEFINKKFQRHLNELKVGWFSTNSDVNLGCTLTLDTLYSKTKNIVCV